MKADLGITFAGGGSRAFYQIGLLEVWGEQLLPRLAGVAGCSAGAAMATIVLTESLNEVQPFFEQQRKGVLGHMQLRRLAKRKRPFPHDEIYRKTLLFALENGGFEKLRTLPYPVRFLCAGFPQRLPSPIGVALGLGVYQLEKKLKPKMLHPTFPEKIGFSPKWWDARQCTSPKDLVELIISSSSTPPFLARGRYADSLLIDGSMVDNAPAFLLDDLHEVQKNIVIMTRPYDASVMGVSGNRFYVCPSKALPISRWDYRESAPVEETLEIGRQDAMELSSKLERFLQD